MQGLVDHACEELRSLCPAAALTLHQVPGAFEIPVVVREIASQKKADAIIAIGVIMKGGTTHAEHLASSVTTALQQIAIEYGVPVINAVLELENRAAGARALPGEEVEPRDRSRARRDRDCQRHVGAEGAIMGKRRLARQAAVQFHFWRDMQGGEAPEKMDEFWEFCPAKPNVREFAQPLIDGMVAHLPEIDEKIARYCDNYEFRRISPVDRNVLRLAIYEMLLPRRHPAGRLDQ